MMNYKRTLFLTFITIVLFIISIFLGREVFQYRLLYSSNSVEAVVAYGDDFGTYGSADLYRLDEDGEKHNFKWQYPSEYSGIKKDQKVLVYGEITYLNEGSEDAHNSNLIIEPKQRVYGALMSFIIATILFFIGLVVIGVTWAQKPWKKDEEIDTKDKILGIVYAAIFFLGCASIWGSILGIITTGQVIMREHYAIGTVRYVTDAPHSNLIIDEYTPIYDQNIQVILDTPVNDDWVYSITYFNTRGKMIFKEQRVMIFYNEFDESDGVVVSFAGLIYRGVSIAILLIGSIVGVLKYKMKKKND